MFRYFLIVCLFITYTTQAQIFQKKEEEKKGIRLPKYVATKNTFGMIGGVERGKYTFMELGVEKHWKKIRLVHARTLGANANLEYNFGNNVLGYNAAGWIKQGRVDLTYGINLNYVTDFEKSRYGLGPQIGFRLLGLHFVNGYNFLLGDKELTQVNKFYVGARYYFPLRSKTTVVNVNKRKPSEKGKSDDKDNNNSLFKKRDKKSKSSSSKNKKEIKGKKNKKGEQEVAPKKNPFRIFKKKEPEPLPDKKSKKKKKEKKEDSKNKKEEERKSSKFWDYFRNNE